MPKRAVSLLINTLERDEIDDPWQDKAMEPKFWTRLVAALLDSFLIKKKFFCVAARALYTIS